MLFEDGVGSWRWGLDEGWSVKGPREPCSVVGPSTAGKRPGGCVQALTQCNPDANESPGRVSKARGEAII